MAGLGVHAFFFFFFNESFLEVSPTPVSSVKSSCVVARLFFFSVVPLVLALHHNKCTKGEMVEADRFKVRTFGLKVMW